jgi:hypothetical protein
VIIQTYASRLGWTNQPLLKPEAEWFTDRSTFVLNGERKVGYAVVSHKEVIEVEFLPAGTFAQKADLIDLIKALTLGKGKRLNIYRHQICLPGITCSCSHMEGKGTPLQEGIPNKTRKRNSPSIRGYVSTKRSTVIHCWGLQRPDSSDTGKQPGRPKG